MTGTPQIEAMLVDTNQVLVVASEDDRPSFEFFGSVVTADDLAAGRASVARKVVYLAGDLERLRTIPLDGASRVLAIAELSRGHEAAGFEAVGLGRVPLRAAGLGVYYRQFFDDGAEHFRGICAEHTFQSRDRCIRVSAESPAGTKPAHPVSADFDGDGKADLAVLNSNGLGLMRGNGDGTFASPVSQPRLMGRYLLAPVTGDFNGDGKPDLATSSGDVATVLINLGNGTFGPPRDHPSGASSGSHVSGLDAIALGDLNGDHLPDLVVSHGGANTVSVLASSGIGTYAAPVDYRAGDGPSGLAVGDLDRDGRLDLVVANLLGNTISVLFNRGCQ